LLQLNQTIGSSPKIVTVAAVARHIGQGGVSGESDIQRRGCYHARMRDDPHSSGRSVNHQFRKFKRQRSGVPANGLTTPANTLAARDSWSSAFGSPQPSVIVIAQTRQQVSCLSV